MTLLAPLVGPVFPEQLTPVTPVIAHVPDPVGRDPPLGGVTVAVRVYEEPSATRVALGVTTIVGAPKLTRVVDDVETVPTEL